MKKALLIVDVQNDFCEGGALPVNGGLRAASNIGRYLKQSASDYDLIIASRDWHYLGSDNGGHFSDDPDYKTTWPSHCVAYSTGAEYSPLLPTHLVDVHVRKGQGEAAYSAFEGTVGNSDLTLEVVLNMAGVVSLDVCGLATDYCVKESALSSIRLGYKTRVITGLSAAVDWATFDKALQDMEDAGIYVV